MLLLDFRASAYSVCKVVALHNWRGSLALHIHAAAVHWVHGQLGRNSKIGAATALHNHRKQRRHGPKGYQALQSMCSNPSPSQLKHGPNLHVSMSLPVRHLWQMTRHLVCFGEHPKHRHLQQQSFCSVSYTLHTLLAALTACWHAHCCRRPSPLWLWFKAP